jgi:hypothetical protein
MSASDPPAFMSGGLSKTSPMMLDVVDGEGVARGKRCVVHVVLGSDSFATVKHKCEEGLNPLGNWEVASLYMDRADHPHTMHASTSTSCLPCSSSYSGLRL